MVYEAIICDGRGGSRPWISDVAGEKLTLKVTVGFEGLPRRMWDGLFFPTLKFHIHFFSQMVFFWYRMRLAQPLSYNCQNLYTANI